MEFQEPITPAHIRDKILTNSRLSRLWGNSQYWMLWKDKGQQDLIVLCMSSSSTNSVQSLCRTENICWPARGYNLSSIFLLLGSIERRERDSGGDELFRFRRQFSRSNWLEWCHFHSFNIPYLDPWYEDFFSLFSFSRCFALSSHDISRLTPLRREKWDKDWPWRRCKGCWKSAWSSTSRTAMQSLIDAGRLR